jgi:lycopene beta-cyclase
MKPMNHQLFDLVILGGGCAGLSLARNLCNNPDWSKTTVIIESREYYTNDRSWCFWESSDVILRENIAPLIQSQWQSWRYSNEKFSQVHNANGRYYCYIGANHFYQTALEAINSNSFIELWNGKSVIDVNSHRHGFSIILDDKTALLAKKVIDTRPPVLTESRQAKLWQIFYGIEIQTDEPAFDVHVVGLMDELLVKANATQFQYTLPFSENHALIETTVFTPVLHTPDLLLPQLENSLRNRFGPKGYTVIRSEQACLPMGLGLLPTSQFADYSYGGTSAGAIRPATGYAFMRIQRWAYYCANQLSAGESFTSFNYSSLIAKAMDSIFLSVLHDNPALGVTFFQMLAERVDPAALVRFLSDEALISDYWQILKALPAMRFLAYSLGLNKLFYKQEKYL